VTNTAIAGCTDGLTFVFEYIDPVDGYIANPYGTYFSVAATTGVLTYKAPPASFMTGQSEMKLKYRITAKFDNYPSKTAVQYLTITLSNVCLLSRFTSPSTQAAKYYEDGSNAADSVTDFTYTSD